MLNLSINRFYLFASTVITAVALSFPLHSAERHMDIGSLGKEAWSPTTNETQMALCIAEYYCRYTLSDERRKIDRLSGLVETPVLVGESAEASAHANYRAEEEAVISDGFHVGGLLYRDYQRRVRTFLQPYGETQHRLIAVQHLPVADAPTPSADATPFTVYFNVTNGKYGKTLGLPSILYSPGPPFSFHKKDAF